MRLSTSREPGRNSKFHFGWLPNQKMEACKLYTMPKSSFQPDNWALNAMREGPARPKPASRGGGTGRAVASPVAPAEASTKRKRIPAGKPRCFQPQFAPCGAALLPPGQPKESAVGSRAGPAVVGRADPPDPLPLLLSRRRAVPGGAADPPPILR